MPRSEFEPPFSQWNAAPAEQLRHLGELYGVTGLRVIARAGEPWSCNRDEQRVTFSFDPAQPLACNHLTTERRPEGLSSDENSLYVMTHLLGHARDCLDPDWQPPDETDPAAHFFRRMIDDMTIDRQSRAVPLIDAMTDRMYRQYSSDLTMLPPYAQLMQGLRIVSVTDRQPPKVDEPVKKILDRLAQYEKNGHVFDVAKLLSATEITYGERHAIAEECILPYYAELLEDVVTFTLPDAGNEDGAEAGGEGASETPEKDQEVTDNSGVDMDEASSWQNNDDSSLDNHLDSDGNQMAETAETSDQKKDDATEFQDDQSASGTTESDDTGQLPDEAPFEAEEQRQAKCEELAGIVAREMNLRPGDARLYAEALYEWDPVIKNVAAIFLELASSTNRYRAPRYSRDAHMRGVRLHPQALSQVAFQLETGNDQAIWQSVVRQKPRSEYIFGGLDVHFVVDVTASMRGAKGKCAASTALCLMEGLQLARHKASHNQQYRQPDVRTQIIAFGSDTEILTPLSYSPPTEKKGKAYLNLLYPMSRATLVNGALEQVREDAIQASGRQSIVIIVSDSEFGDHEAAVQTVAAMPASTYLTQLVVNDTEYEAIGHHHRRVNDPTQLPRQLYSIVSGYIKNNS